MKTAEEMCLCNVWYDTGLFEGIDNILSIMWGSCPRCPPQDWHRWMWGIYAREFLPGNSDFARFTTCGSDETNMI